MSKTRELFKTILELAPHILSLVALLGAGLIRPVGGKLVTHDPWILFVHQLKKQAKIPTRNVVKIAMDLYKTLTPEMKDELIRTHHLSPHIIQQAEKMYREYAQSTLPPVYTQERILERMKKIALEDLPITSETMQQVFSKEGMVWTQYVLPDGRIIWKLQPVKVRGLTPEPLFTLPSNILSPPQPIPALIKEEMRQLEPPSNLEPLSYVEVKSERPYEEEREPIFPTIEELSSIKEPSEAEEGPLDQPALFNESLTPMSKEKYDKLYNEFYNEPPKIQKFVRLINTKGNKNDSLKKYGINPNSNLYNLISRKLDEYYDLFPESKFKIRKRVYGAIPTRPPPQPSAKKSSKKK